MTCNVLRNEASLKKIRKLRWWSLKSETRLLRRSFVFHYLLLLNFYFDLDTKAGYVICVRHVYMLETWSTLSLDFVKVRKNVTVWIKIQLCYYIFEASPPFSGQQVLSILMYDWLANEQRQWRSKIINSKHTLISKRIVIRFKHSTRKNIRFPQNNT